MMLNHEREMLRLLSVIAQQIERIADVVEPQRKEEEQRRADDRWRR